jgi:hypothetical protein
MNMQVRSWEAFLFAVVDGEVNSKAVERMLKLASSVAAKKGISKILIDGSRVTGTLSAVHRVELGENLGEHIGNLGGKPSVAFVGHPPTFNGLAVLAGRHKGINVMLFDNTSDAIAWLRRGRISEKDIRAVAAASAHA